jgi:hypothetical protein
MTLRSKSTLKNSSRSSLARPKRWTANASRSVEWSVIGEDAPREVELLRPPLEPGLFRRTANFPEHSGQRSDAAAVFVNVNGAGGSEFLQAGL